MYNLQELPCVCDFIISLRKRVSIHYQRLLIFFLIKSTAVYTNISDFFKEPNIQVWITESAY